MPSPPGPARRAVDAARKRRTRAARVLASPDLEAQHREIAPRLIALAALSLPPPHSVHAAANVLAMRFESTKERRWVLDLAKEELARAVAEGPDMLARMVRATISYLALRTLAAASVDAINPRDFPNTMMRLSFLSKALNLGANDNVDPSPLMDFGGSPKVDDAGAAAPNDGEQERDEVA